MIRPPRIWIELPDNHATGDALLLRLVTKTPRRGTRALRTTLLRLTLSLQVKSSMSELPSTKHCPSAQSNLLPGREITAVDSMDSHDQLVTDLFLTYTIL